MNIPIPSEEEFDRKINIEHEYETIKEATQWRIILYLKNFIVLFIILTELVYSIGKLFIWKK